MASAWQAIGRGDAVGVRQAAHTLKGSVGYFGAPTVFAAAQELERLAGSGNLDTAADAWRLPAARELTA